MYAASAITNGSEGSLPGLRRPSGTGSPAWRRPSVFVPEPPPPGMFHIYDTRGNRLTAESALGARQQQQQQQQQQQRARRPSRRNSAHAAPVPVTDARYRLPPSPQLGQGTPGVWPIGSAQLGAAGAATDETTSWILFPQRQRQRRRVQWAQPVASPPATLQQQQQQRQQQRRRSSRTSALKGTNDVAAVTATTFSGLASVIPHGTDIATRSPTTRRGSLGAGIGRPQTVAYAAGAAFPSSPSSPYNATLGGAPSQRARQHIPPNLVNPDDYMASATYEQFVDHLCTHGRHAISNYMQRPRLGKAAMVFDVDDTLVRTSKKAQQDFAAQMMALGRTVPRGYLPPLAPVVDLYKWAKAQGIRTVLITGRPETSKAVTLANLEWLGIGGWDHTFFCDPTYHGPREPFKSRTRALMATDDYDIVANVGDQESDVRGPHSGVVIKLPNPSYHIA